MKITAYVVLSLVFATITLLSPDNMITLVYPLIGVIIALLSRSLIASFTVVLANTIISLDYLEAAIKSIYIPLLGNTLNALIELVGIALPTIYLLVLLFSSLKNGYIKDYIVEGMLQSKRLFSELRPESIGKASIQLLYASLLTLILGFIKPAIPPHTIYLYMISIPAYLLSIVVYDSTPYQLMTAYIFSSSLRYPPLIFTIYYMRNLETLEYSIRLAKRDGAKIGLAVAILLEKPLMKYTSRDLQSSRGKTYAWSPLDSGIPYRLAISIDHNPHIIITGASGTGKSYTASIIAEKMSSTTKSSIIILDPHGEYKELFKDNYVIIEALNNSINPLDLQGKGPRQRAIEVSSMISSIFRLGPLQSRILEDAILLAYESKGILENKPETWLNTPPTLLDVAKILRIMAKRDNRAAIVATYIESLASRVFAKTSISLDEIMGKPIPVIIDLSTIVERAWQRLYMTLFLERLYMHMKELGLARKLRVILVIDEAHLVASKDSRKGILASIAAELRKYGLSLILITQRLDELEKSILANTGTKIALRQVEPKLARYVAESIAVSTDRDEIDTLMKTLSSLPRGYVIIRDYYLDTPILVKIQGNI